METSAIKTLIARGRLKEAFELGAKHPEIFGEAYLNEFLLLQNQFQRIEKERRLNLQEGTVELNKVIHGFLELLSEVSPKNGSQPSQNLPALLALNEAKLLYEFNRPFFQAFRGAEKQIETSLKTESFPSDFPATLRKSLDQLAWLKEKMDGVSLLSQTHESNFGDPELTARARRLLDYIQNEMKLPEINGQLRQLAELEKEFQRYGQRQHLPVYVVMGILVLLAAAVVIAVVYMVKN
ncbi:MAG: hypothetical protein H6558_21680 [Lewinellaceae bacterium]|nr:hypothetical protein [Lewinellaceae bacterium]